MMDSLENLFTLLHKHCLPVFILSPTCSIIMEPMCLSLCILKLVWADYSEILIYIMAIRREMRGYFFSCIFILHNSYGRDLCGVLHFM